MSELTAEETALFLRSQWIGVFQSELGFDGRIEVHSDMGERSESRK